jgi:molybdopterin-biosynthesis enzyme MoeA-like protein
MLRQARTAGLIIIGDEILAAKTQDSNSAFAIQRLRADGVALKRAVLVSDDFDTIRDEVRNLCAQKFKL